MARTDAELFDTITNWDKRNSRYPRTTFVPVVREQCKTESLGALSATRDLVESLQTGYWEMITAARLGGATWSEIASAMSHGDIAEALRAEYANLVDWYGAHPSISVDVARWRAALLGGRPAN